MAKKRHEALFTDHPGTRDKGSFAGLFPLRRSVGQFEKEAMAEAVSEGRDFEMPAVAVKA